MLQTSRRKQLLFVAKTSHFVYDLENQTSLALLLSNIISICQFSRAPLLVENFFSFPCFNFSFLIILQHDLNIIATNIVWRLKNLLHKGKKNQFLLFQKHFISLMAPFFLEHILTFAEHPDNLLGKKLKQWFWMCCKINLFH